MKRSILYFLFFLCSFTLSELPSAWADMFGSGEHSFEIEFVPIGDPGNAPDTSGSPNPAGSVSYEYRMGKFEISEQMIDKANSLGGLGITKDTRGPNKPATSIDWFEAARFVNWLNESTGNMPAYKFVEMPNPRPQLPPTLEFALWEPGDPGYSANNLFRNRLTKYVLPSVDEWYKAAYYDPVASSWLNYPTQNGDPPLPVANGTDPNTAVYLQDLSAGPANIMNAGGLSIFGTMAQGGNVSEWHETAFDLLNNEPNRERLIGGGFWESTSFPLSTTGVGGALPFIGIFGIGFRVASIPEPQTVNLFIVCLCLLHMFRRTTS